MVRRGKSYSVVPNLCVKVRVTASPPLKGSQMDSGHLSSLSLDVTSR